MTNNSSNNSPNNFWCVVFSAQWDDKDNQGWKFLGVPLGNRKLQCLYLI